MIQKLQVDMWENSAHGLLRCPPADRTIHDARGPGCNLIAVCTRFVLQSSITLHFNGLWSASTRVDRQQGARASYVRESHMRMQLCASISRQTWPCWQMACLEIDDGHVITRAVGRPELSDFDNSRRKRALAINPVNAPLLVSSPDYRTHTIFFWH
jgi:hypothetical protein